MREAFASLTELGARVEGLEAAAGAAAAAAEAGDGLVIPMEGFAVAPYAPPEPGDGGDEFGVDGASVGAISYIAPPPLPAALRLPALAAAAGVGNPAAPALRLRIQSISGSGAAAAAAGLESLVIERLVMKADPHPALRLLAASRGALENVARNVNPFAGAWQLGDRATVAAWYGTGSSSGSGSESGSGFMPPTWIRVAGAGDQGGGGAAVGGDSDTGEEGPLALLPDKQAD
eukprot:XP_001696784.1 predicted protein [Chlamydomonas reinhardtii]